MKVLRFLSGLALFAVALFVAGCNGGASANNGSAKNANGAANNANAAATPSPANAENTSSAGTIGSLATPTDAYKTAYELRKAGDIEGLKKVMTPDILDFLTDMGKDQNKSLDDMLRDLVKSPQATTAQSRNEKIDGDHATVEYLDEDGNWPTMDFEKVGNDWKLSAPKKDSQTPPSPPAKKR